MIRAGVAIATAMVVFSIGARASAEERRIAVASLDGRGALSLRLGAELGELGYQVVPLGNDEWRDGVTLLKALERTHSTASLTLEETALGIEACVVQREVAGHACTTIRSDNDAEVATRAAELVRASVVEQTAAPAEPPARAVATSTTTAEAPPPSNVDEAAGHTLEGRVGPGVVLANGMQAEFAAGIGFDWILDPHLVIGAEAMIPISTSSIERDVGSMTARATSGDLHVDGRFATGRWETAVGLGFGAMWLQVNGSAPAPQQSQDDSLLDPFATMHGELAVFLNRSLAIRTDVSAGYVLSKATIRFVGKEVAEIGRPLAGSTVSLAFSWP